MDQATINDLKQFIETTVQSRFDGLREQLGDGFSTIDARFNTVDTRFDAVNARLDAVDSRLDSVDSRLDSVDSRFDAVDSRFDAVDARFDTVDERINDLSEQLGNVRHGLYRRITAFEGKFDVMVDAMSESYMNHEVRLRNLESRHV